MSKIQWLADYNANLTAEERFKQWFASKFDDNYKRDVATAIREGLTPLKNRVVSNVQGSGFNDVAGLSQGVVLSTDIDKSSGKVHILGRRGRGGFLRIFELGTYKSPNHKPQLKAREWFTQALQEMGSTIEPNVIAALEKIMRKNGIING